jgi:membrane protein YqaA with SNARE-associated domain
MDDSTTEAVGAVIEAPRPRRARRSPAQRRARRRKAAKVLAALLGITGLIALQMHRSSGEAIARLIDQGGYIGVAFASALSGFNLAVPIPIITFYPSMLEAGLHPTFTILLISLGMTAGDAVGCTIGVYGRRAFELPRNAFTAWIDRTRHSRPWLLWVVLALYAAFVPLPNEVIVMPLAFFGFRPAGIVASVLAGNLVFNWLAAHGLLQIAEAAELG